MRLLALWFLVGLLAPGMSHAAFRAKARDFKCLTKGVKAEGKHFYIFNRNRKRLREAVEMSRSGDLGRGYPKGTILQLLPGEAMAKRGGRYNPDGNGWEWFKLTFTSDGRAKIAARGGAEVANFLGSCQGCHARVAPTHDMVCEFVIGANGLGLTDAQLEQLQASDPRCKKKP
jgi:hypothetical protein